MQLQAMEAHLAKTWKVLVGEDLNFCAQSICSQDLLTQHYFVVTLHPHPSGHLAGVGLAIGEQDARQLASQMFAQAANKLSSADIADACRELCNVFASGVPTHINKNLMLDLGLPSPIRHEQFRIILAASSVSSSFIARLPDRHIQVIVFDHLEIPEDAGWSPST
jgi:hypothetical protein